MYVSIDISSVHYRVKNDSVCLEFIFKAFFSNALGRARNTK